jgi:nitrite reductase/ring-hydroxylating ferredoxin subunit
VTALKSIRPEPVSAIALPAAPRSWYFVCRSRDLPPGRVITWTLLGHALVVYRGHGGAVVALDARCVHMGAHLGRGTVVGDTLQCALHHWTHDPAGVCHAPAGHACLSQPVYPVVERSGAVFVFAGREATFEFPSIGDTEDPPLHVIVGRPALVQTSWGSIATNAFDVAHMQAVHKRALRQDPDVRLLGSDGLELAYESRVTGHGLSDRVVKWLSGDCIRATIRCWGGTVIVVRSEVGALRSRLMLCATPKAGGVEIVPIFAVPRTGFKALDAVRARTTGWLFTAFLKRDLVPLAGMDLRLAGALQAPGPVGWLTRWLTTLPAAEFRHADL